MLQIKLLSPNAKVPVKSHPGEDAGFDVFALEDAYLSPKDFKVFNLGFALSFEPGYVCLVQGRSGLATRSGVFTIGNVIDSGYRGECHATLVNSGIDAVKIKAGDKIAQLLFLKLSPDQILDQVEILESSNRANNGLGSTGG